jgi:hypothetical protein
MMFLLTKRVIKQNRAAQAGDKYAPRTENTTSWQVSGPFSSPAAAAKAAINALGTHTCLAAQVVTEQQLRSMAEDRDADHQMHRALVYALKHLTQPTQV